MDQWLESVSQTGWVDPNCWAATSSEIVEPGSKMDLVQIRVRIPEIHVAIDIPTDLPDRLISDKNHDIINRYPVFVSQFSTATEPSAGDLVWVDFQNKEAQMGPIFLGVAESNSFAAKSQSKSSEEASAAFKKIGASGRKIKKTTGSKRDVPENLFDYSLKYNNKDSILTGMFPPGVEEGTESEESFKQNFDSGFFKTAGSPTGTTYYDLVKEALKEYNKDIPIALVAALMQLESRFNHRAGAKTSSAKGLGQFLDSTRNQKKYFHPDPFNVDKHIPMVVKLIASLFNIKCNHPPTAIHAYWGGAGDTPPSGTKIWNGSESPYQNPYYPEKIFRRFEQYQFGVSFVDTPFRYTQYYTYRLDGGTNWLTSKGTKGNK